MTVLRDYQQRTIDQLYEWFGAGNHGNPCLVLPTGSGKSHIVAALCKDALQNWPETVVLMLTHVKELIEQNAEKMRQHWPGAPLGIYSASIGKKQLGEPITFAGIQSVRTKAKLDTTGVHMRGGEFIESELQAAVDTKDNNERVVREILDLAGERKAWLVFCTGVKHAEHIAAVLRQHGVAAECVTGETPKKERERMLADFKAGRLRALTNANVLTTGFDYPDIDLIAMLRPTMSASLYVQMAGRGMRVKSHIDHCLVLDFAGVVATHGPITAVQPPKKGGDGNGEAPVKVCDNCGELCAISATICPACLHPFPEPERKKLELRNDDIMGLEGSDLDVTAWSWRKHLSKASGKEMIAVTYYGGLSDPAITEYLPILHEGYAGQMAMQKLVNMAERSQIVPGGLNVQSLEEMVANMNQTQPPASIEFKRDGKFFRVMKRRWA